MWTDHSCFVRRRNNNCDVDIHTGSKMETRARGNLQKGVYRRFFVAI